MRQRQVSSRHRIRSVLQRLSPGADASRKISTAKRSPGSFLEGVGSPFDFLPGGELPEESRLDSRSFLVAGRTVESREVKMRAGLVPVELAGFFQVFGCFICLPSPDQRCTQIIVKRIIIVASGQ